MSPKTNVYAVDALRTLSILAVVMIHTTSRTLEYFQYDLNRFPMALFLNQLARFAVPLFFLLSGFVLELNFHLNESYLHFFKKRVDRILFPYLFWSGLYYFLIYRADPDSFIKAILTGSASYQLYFIPSLIIFYALFPLLHKLMGIISKWRVLLVLGAVQLVILYNEYYLKNIHMEFPIAVAIFNFYVFFLGMVASKNYEKLLSFFGKIKYFLLTGVVGGVGYLFWEGRHFYYQTWNIDAFYSSWRPSVLIYTLLIGSAAFYFFSKIGKGGRFIKTLSKLSFFVFFIHTFLLEEIWRIIGSSWKAWYDIPFFLAVSLACFLIAYIVHKIPYLNKLTG